jgi:hypothetical protein
VPFARLLYVLIFAVRFASQSPPSNLVWKVASEGSVDEKVNVAFLLLTVPEGPSVMVVSGAVVSAGGAAVVNVQVLAWLSAVLGS